MIELLAVFSQGVSMEPTMPACRKETFIEITREVEVDDIAVFICNSPKCQQGSVPSGAYAKRVQSITEYRGEKCYRLYGDNMEKSWDSREYGELCGKEIEVVGKVRGWGECRES